MLRSVAVLGDGCPGGRWPPAGPGPPPACPSGPGHIVARITEVDRWITPERQRKVVEVHPELSFRRLDPRVVEPKPTARGTGHRPGRGSRMEIRL